MMKIDASISITITNLLAEVESSFGIKFDNPALIVPDSKTDWWPSIIKIGDVEIPVILRGEFPGDPLFESASEDEVHLVNLLK